LLNNTLKLIFLKFNYLKYINNKWDVQAEDVAQEAAPAEVVAQVVATN
jgi:hypothetical protein